MMDLHHIAILAAEKKRAIAFYSALGFAVQACFSRPERGDEIVFMTQGNITLEVFVAPDHPARVTDPEAYGLRHLALKSACVAEIRDELLQAGYQPEPIRTDSISGGQMFFVKDPDGLPIEIHE